MCFNREGVLQDRREMLRVKVKSLAEEARIIRREEHKCHGLLKDELIDHRRMVVRHAARQSHIAYALIKGVPLEKIEQPKLPRSEAFWKEIRKMIERYGPLDVGRKQAVLAVCK